RGRTEMPGRCPQLLLKTSRVALLPSGRKPPVAISHRGARPCPPLSGRAEAPGCDSHLGARPCPPLSGRAEAPGCDSHPGARPCPPLSGRAEAPGCDSHLGTCFCPRRQQCVARALYPRAAALRLMCGGSPRLRIALWCGLLSVASAVGSQGTLPAGCRPAAQVWRKPTVANCTLVRASVRGVSSA
ncbi:MAG: hypothetical protein RLZZ436_2199, partial [Planctomycetota bacterium]